MRDTLDAVLIGAGHNTLACALQLAKKGWRVGLFEQAPIAGGAVKTGEYTLPGYRLRARLQERLGLVGGGADYRLVVEIATRETGIAVSTRSSFDS